MSVAEDRREADRDIEETLGLNLDMFRRVPDYLLPTEWASFKSLVLSDQTAIPNKYKEMIGLAVSGATRWRYCAYFHTEAARLFGAPEDEIASHTGCEVDHHIGAGIADARHRLPIERRIAGRRAGLRMAHMDMDDRGARLGSLDRRSRDVARRQRHLVAAGGGAAGARQRAGDEGLEIHGRP